METQTAVAMLAALSHGGRLSIFRLLVQAGPPGVPAGTISQHLSMPPSTLSAHLAVLSRAGLAAGRREGRSIIYSASYGAMTGLIGFLVQDCCEGAAEVCAPLQEMVLAAACCPDRPIPYPEEIR